MPDTYADYYRKRYYTAAGKPRKIIPCLKEGCGGKMRGHLEDPTFISGDLYVFVCPKCGEIDEASL